MTADQKIIIQRKLEKLYAFLKDLDLPTYGDIGNGSALQLQTMIEDLQFIVEHIEKLV